MKKIKNSFWVKIIINAINEEISVYSAQTTFFMILSFFPLIILLLNIISFTSLSGNFIPDLISSYAPETIKPFLISIVKELQRNSSTTILSITAILTIWSASKGTLSIISGMRKIYNSDKSTNYFLLRILSIGYTLLLVVSIATTFTLLVIGNSFVRNIIINNPHFYFANILFFIIRYIIAVTLLTLYFLSVYKIGSNKEYTISDLVPGALFSSLGWMIFSFLFSIYIEHFSNFSFMYGSITSIIIIMLWIYFCMCIMFIGGLINRMFFDHK